MAGLLHDGAAPRIVGRTVEASTWQDDGFEVARESVTCRFADGTAIRRTIERDLLPGDAGLCPEC